MRVGQETVSKSRTPLVPNISDKILLRQVQTSDIIDLIEISFYDSIQATTLQQATEMQAKINKDYFEGNSIHWGIADKLTNKNARLPRNHKPALDHI